VKLKVGCKYDSEKSPEEKPVGLSLTLMPFAQVVEEAMLPFPLRTAAMGLHKRSRKLLSLRGIATPPPRALSGRQTNYFHYLEISSPVRRALERGKPVVALESTIISHGECFRSW